MNWKAFWEGFMEGANVLLLLQKLLRAAKPWAAWTVAHTLYFLGDLVDSLAERALCAAERATEWAGSVCYRTYNRLMLASLSVQKWGGGRGPWQVSQQGGDDESAV